MFYSLTVTVNGKSSYIAWCCRYPYNNFLHHHVENIIVSCLGVKRNQLTDHILNDCGLVGKVLAAEKGPSLPVESNGVNLFLDTCHLVFFFAGLCRQYFDCALCL